MSQKKLAGKNSPNNNIITVNRYKKLLAENHYLDPIRLQQDHHHFLESLLHCWVILFDQPE